VRPPGRCCARCSRVLALTCPVVAFCERCGRQPGCPSALLGMGSPTVAASWRVVSALCMSAMMVVWTLPLFLDACCQPWCASSRSMLLSAGTATCALRMRAGGSGMKAVHDERQFYGPRGRI